MTDPETTAQDILRDDILAGGHDDWVSMADVQGRIARRQLAELEADRQQLVVDTVRSLLVDGLVEVGVIPGRNNPGFKTWPGTIDEVMKRFTDLFIGHHDDPHMWEYAIWLNLTAKGEQASADVVRKRSDRRAGR
jgi:hypothetical protein